MSTKTSIEMKQVLNRNGKFATIRDIARIAKVSPATVSLILNKRNDSKFSDETKQKIHNISQQLGYQNSLFKRFVKTPMKHIGILVTDANEAETTYFAEVLKGIRQACMEHNFLPVLCPTESRCPSGIADQIIKMTSANQVKGWIIDKEDTLDSEVCKLQDAGIPIVLINSWEPVFKGEINWVGINNRQGARLALEHLIKIGHRTIAFITRPYDSLEPQFRRATDNELISEYKQVLSEHEIEFRPELLCEGSLANAELVDRVIDRLMRYCMPPMAIVTGDDAIAIMAMNSLRARGYRVPDEISVVGYGNHSLARLSYPPLTTVDCPFAKMGALAAAHLVNLLAENQHKLLRKSLEPELIVRSSCKSML
ncbi:MAG: hypothetical protein A2Y12_17910 [Planctomycetes bacterium GWF2_42_9]|nr:MAG: hypothetical protein A2Y12_17910 [Planctomycetes bacterium GWF2_42_9]